MNYIVQLINRKAFVSYFYSFVCTFSHLFQPLLILQVWMFCSGMPDINLEEENFLLKERDILWNIHSPFNQAYTVCTWASYLSYPI